MQKCYKHSIYPPRFWSHFLGKDGAVTNYGWYLPMFSLTTAKDLTNATKDYFVEDNFTTFVMTSEKGKLHSKQKICKIA
ncbi:hypothetical protein AGMMS49936_03770 [Endomicrobiia bacterium]|nr:hypothetical protein AGMMS49936_03770 [Endomicrobiia bacterium]